MLVRKMSKYDELWKYIIDKNEESLQLSFEEIKNILGFEIDHSFLNYKKELIEYGYNVKKIMLKNKIVLFSKEMK